MKNEELILITNDDGFKAKGLKVLKSIAKNYLIMFGNFLRYLIIQEKVIQLQ